MSLRFIRISADTKIPIDKLSDGGFPFSKVSNHPDLGILIPEGFVVFDIDDKEESDILFAIIKARGIKCKVMQTTRGKHFWFRSKQPLTNHVDVTTALGINIDIRSFGKLSYVKVKDKGVMRTWLQRDDEVDFFPPFLQVVRKAVRMSTLNEGSRNDTLFRNILALQNAGMSREEIRDTYSLINEFVLKDPLDDSELETILRDEAFETQNEENAKSGVFTPEGKFSHNSFGDVIINRLTPLTVNGSMYIYKDGYYQMADRSVEQLMVRILPIIKRNQRTEVLEYMKLVTMVDDNDIEYNPYIVNIKNGRLDIRNDSLLPFTPMVHDFAQLPITYDPEAYDENVDKMLDKVFCNDKEIRDLFEEFVGYILLGNNKYGKMILMLGGGSNGKSTILDMLKNFAGSSNYSTLGLGEIGERFKTAELENKILNAGDDINDSQIDLTGDLKKAVTGEEILVDRKNEHPFKLKNKAKLMFSANKLPYIADKSWGMERRLIILPMFATFSSNDPDFDPFIEEKLRTDNALSYLLNLGLKGIKRVFKYNEFTKPKAVERELMKFKISNSYTLTWVRDTQLTMDTLLNTSITNLYSQLGSYLIGINVRRNSTPNIKTFESEIRREFNMDVELRDNTLYFVRKDNSEEIDVLLKR